MSQLLKTQTVRLDTLASFSGAIRGIVAGDTGNRLQMLLTAVTLRGRDHPERRQVPILVYLRARTWTGS